MLGVFGLSHYTRQRDLEEIFSKYGRIKEAMIVMDRRVGQRPPLALANLLFLLRATNLAALDSSTLTVCRMRSEH